MRQRKTSQINGMVKTAGVAGNRLALLINFYSDTVLLIPIHGLCVAGKKEKKKPPPVSGLLLVLFQLAFSAI